MYVKPDYWSVANCRRSSLFAPFLFCECCRRVRKITLNGARPAEASSMEQNPLRHHLGMTLLWLVISRFSWAI